MLEKYLQQLIDQAPDYGVPSQVMEGAIIPVLQRYAASLNHSQYYIAENNEGNWLITVLEAQEMPPQEKRVIYAFDSIDTAAKAIMSSKNKLKRLGTTRLLFEIFARREIDSIIFLDSRSLKGQEIVREALSQDINTTLKQFLPPSAYC